MEQEPVYVPSGKLVSVCESVLGRIYDTRQANREQYVQARTQAYNQAVRNHNQRYRWAQRLFGVKPKMMITPDGMELLIRDEVRAMPVEQAAQHPMIAIHQEYGQLEHEAKDAMIMARLSDVVPISADFARGISHLGVDPSFMRKDPFGFGPR